MRHILGISVVFSLCLNPIAVMADNLFATVETVRSQDSNLIISSLSTSASNTPDDDGVFSFSGFIDDQAASWVVPLTVEIDTAGLEVAPTLAEIAEFTNKITVLNSFSFLPELGDVPVEKTVVSLVVNEDESRSTMIITDDPVPAVAWLAFAGIVSLTGISIYYVEKCKSVKLVSSADVKNLKMETSLECQNE